MASFKTGLLILNKTPFQMHLKVSEIDNYDWDGISRPDRNINGRSVEAKGSIEEREEINAYASSCWYRLHFSFQNGASFSQRFDQRLSRKENWSATYIYETNGITYTVTAKATRNASYDKLMFISIDAVKHFVPFRAESWMTDNRDFLSNKSLRDICLLGSHDAGMGTIKHMTPLASEDNTRTQYVEIYQQLLYGARYFDIRPIIGSPSEYYYLTGHYGHIKELATWQGANGQPVSTIVDDINKFTKNKKEVIILNLSHALNTNVGNNSYRPFTQEEWNGLFRILEKIEAKYDSTSIGDLTQVKIGDLTKNQSCVLIVAEDVSNITLPCYIAASQNKFKVSGEYSNTPVLEYMVHDQIDKMCRMSKDNYFLLSWTLTQSANEVILGPSILTLAERANEHLLHSFFNYFSLNQNCYPNIIYIDGINKPDYAALAMQINNRLYDNKTES